MKRTVLIASLALVLSAGPTAATFEECQATLKAMRELVEELRGFEKSQTFAFYGFGKGGPHFEWMEKAKALRDRTSGANFIAFTATDNVAFPGDIILWGLEKMRCATRRGQCDREHIKYVEDQLRGMKCKRR